MKIIDLKSDTVTVPDEGMRKAMYQAEVGDDVYGEDPTVNKLQELAAEITGKEAALFVPSGSMGNLVSMFVLTKRGDEVIAHKDSHIFHYEVSSMAVVAGIMPRPVEGKEGKLTCSSVRAAFRPKIYSMPRTGLIELENTHNAAGGYYYSEQELKSLSKLSAELGIPLHMDGARVFNSSCASGISVREIASHCATITFCLSKGLGAPAGSMLCGTSEFIAEARRVRKMLGGGMRQAGVLAAAGIYALKNNIPKLQKDHDNAKMIAESIEKSGPFRLQNSEVPTNIIYFTVEGKDTGEVISYFRNKGILFSEGPVMRIVTNLNVSHEDAEEVCRAFESF